MNILDLPAELLLYICKFLNIQSKVQFGQANKKLKAIATDRTLYNLILLKEQQHLTDKDLNRLLTTCCDPSVQRIDLWHSPCIQGDFFTSCKYLFISLVEIDVTGTILTDLSLSLIWKESCVHGKLKILRFMDCNRLTDNITTEIKSLHPSLELLQISHQGMKLNNFLTSHPGWLLRKSTSPPRNLPARLKNFRLSNFVQFFFIKEQSATKKNKQIRAKYLLTNAVHQHAYEILLIYNINIYAVSHLYET